MRYTKKPVTIDAMPVSRVLYFAEKDWQSLPHWISAAYERGDLLFLSNKIIITTPEGKMTADIDDWLILGIKGELYPCKPDIFKLTYEEAKNEF